MGWKDTVKANPGELTVVRAKFSLPERRQQWPATTTFITATSWSTRTTT